MKKLITLCAVLPFLIAQVFGQNTGTIKGKVYDEGTKIALFGAVIAVTNGSSNVGCQSDC